MSTLGTFVEKALVQIMKQKEEAKPDIKTTRGTDHLKNWQVVLFNDDNHSFSQVAKQLILATNCNPERAMEYTLQVHQEGSAVVYMSHKEQCDAVATVLEEVRLLVKVVQGEEK